MVNEQSKRLRFLKLRINGHPLFKDGTEFSIFSSSKVSPDNDENVYNLNRRFYHNKVEALTGKNATGKTTLMKLIIGVLNLLISPRDEMIESTSLKNSLRAPIPTNMEVYFYTTDGFVIKDAISFEFIEDRELKKGRWIISSEKIYKKKISKVDSKSAFFDFDDASYLEKDRADFPYYPSSASIFKNVIGDYYMQLIFDVLMFTNVNGLFVYGAENIPTELLEFIDPSIEYLKVCTEKSEDGHEIQYYRLKFKGSSKEIVEYNLPKLSLLLSSGTQKAISLYDTVIATLKTGGILFIDEIENHFNAELLKEFIGFFTNPKINIYGAVLIFSTHYIELLDSDYLTRGDSVYIASRKETQVDITKYSELDVRSDYSKTAVFKASVQRPTAPSYEAQMRLTSYTEELVRGANENA